MARDRAEHQLVIAAPPQPVFEALVDYESMPEWQSSVRSCEVLERDASGRGRVVRWVLDAKLRDVSYTLRYEYEEPHLIATEYVEGDVAGIDGEYVLEDRRDGSSLVTLSLRIDPGMWVPAKVRDLLGEQVMRRSLEDLRRRVEDAG